MKLIDLISVLHFYKCDQELNHIEVSGIEMDSRQVKKGDVFVCITGYTVDGHDFAEQVAEKGACAVIAERPLSLDIPVIVVNDTTKALSHLANRFYNNPSQAFRLIGVTGTNGKTTLTYLLNEIFEIQKETTGLIGTIQMKIAEKKYSVQNTTPNALVLQRAFHDMVKEKVTTAVMEVSSHALDLGRVYGTDFDIAVFTNLSQDHLDYHKTMDDYFRAKSLLFSQMGNVYTGKPKYAVINADDPYGEKLARSTPYEVVKYGLNENADVQAKDLELHANGTSFNMITPVGNVHIKSPLAGKFSVYNILAASSAAICAGVSLKTLQYAFANTNGVPGRFETVQKDQEFGVIVDYAHTPDSLENVLTTVQTIATGKIYVVIGCGGDRDKGKRPKMAEVAVKGSHLAVFTSDNPRTEDPFAILEDMTRDISSQNFVVEQDRKKAIAYAINKAEAGDVVLIAGKGHETYQEVDKQRFEFDDRAIAGQLIEEKLKGRI
ncbi:UDP-N-acetylmuramoyl-L-alanyl-D-glutamate--2,6-diaminopimelate ligase [Salirhabdus euzebyi]|uniref:UDP-N-acetylmuramoyl-L-alanyl-D-glutamate--2,6-diaminopimelate ligase n=1 Tax=Salirhabdus euzebyi TaxID=394506 RepID=A0A841Q9F6_9BACI|nr:UDP-N-acetylmuramoyl-L-alanyl-D-glutamate--2,6-diaminopimelate ligase [Salirhabdus euzebyi]MBB6455026.1 UDP-N-acetylmuramoyl-L-alanyl-D-glutamate--2,6-diaminopimelate ligase [Salirhabdus euzebyi]